MWFAYASIQAWVEIIKVPLKQTAEYVHKCKFYKCLRSATMNCNGIVKVIGELVFGRIV